MNAIGADHGIGRCTRSSGKSERRLVLVLLKADTSVAGIDDFGWQPADEHAEQVGPVHAVELDLARQLGRPHRSGEGSVGTAKLRIDPPGPVTEKLVAEPKPLQHAHAVWLDGNAGTDLCESGGLLIKTDVHAVLNEGCGSGSTTDAAANNGDTKWMLGHANHLLRCATLQATPRAG